MGTMHSSRESLVEAIAGIQAKADGLTLPIKSLILKTEGPQTLLDSVFEEGLINPERDAALESAERQLVVWENAGYDVVPIFDDRYPRQLRQVHEAPGIIFSVGSMVPDDQAVSVVGSRQAGPAVMQAARDVASHLAHESITVVSGLARGIDAAAHEAALRAGGRTVAIMGTGLDQTYPAEHADLRQEIENQGQVITQFFPGAAIKKHNFPMRNATMSGYGAATIVISASEKSGTRHQARAAIGHGHALILTPSVAENTSWGREYANRGDAYVVYSPEEAVQYVLDAIHKNQAAKELFI
jgi:SMF family protein